MKNKIPTVEEFLTSKAVEWHNDRHELADNVSPKDLIEFTKLHVKAALIAAHRNMQLEDEDLDFTLNSYPLDNIK